MHSSGKTNARRHFHSLAAKRQLYLRFWGVMASFARFLVARKNNGLSTNYFARLFSRCAFKSRFIIKRKNSHAYIIRGILSDILMLYLKICKIRINTFAGVSICLKTQNVKHYVQES